jgi:Sulfotransferase domain/N-terminal domain of galactosyltransferase
VTILINDEKVLKIAFCTTCKGRAHHLKQTLSRNLMDNYDYPNAIFVILDYGSQDDLQEYMREWVGSRVVLYSYAEQRSFHMSHAKNMAHRCGLLEGADVLVNLDADNYTGAGFATYLAEQFKEHGKNSFMWSCMVPGVMPPGINGRIAVTREAFLKAGGYDERFSAWGRDDRDFCERLERLHCAPYEIAPRFLDGVRHTNRARFKEYPHARTLVAGEAEPKNIEATTTIANFGRVGLGTVVRNFGCDPIVLRTLPTRIFGIGMHRTGTSSLHTALDILGLDSVHWPDAKWARKVYNEVRTHGRSQTLERRYSASDLPISVLFHTLDAMYPNSRFILTLRNENNWLTSIERHFSYEGNASRARWDNDTFSHQIHQEVYGRTTFDSDQFLKRYRYHTDEVLMHFDHRPEDLLVMDMDDGAGWQELCTFLGKPIPDIDYPKINIGKC